jgi:hypothetical protein
VEHLPVEQNILNIVRQTKILYLKTGFFGILKDLFVINVPWRRFPVVAGFFWRGASFFPGLERGIKQVGFFSMKFHMRNLLNAVLLLGGV